MQRLIAPSGIWVKVISNPFYACAKQMFTSEPIIKLKILNQS